MTDLDRARAILDAATPPEWRAVRDGRIQTLFDIRDEPDNDALIAAAVYEADARAIALSRNLLPAALDVVEAAGDVYRIAVSEHGHDESHEAIWPSCLPAHIALNRYRAALAAFHAKMKETL